MRRLMQDVCDDPLGADEQMMAGWEEALEECGMGMHREPRKVVMRRVLDYSWIATDDQDGE